MIFRRQLPLAGLAVLAALVASLPARGQEAINFDSALQPSAGATIIRQQLRYMTAEMPGMNREIEQYRAATTIVHGLNADFTLMFNAPILFREITDNNTGMKHRDEGFGDPRVVGKWRLFLKDTGPTDTLRLSLLTGMEVRSGDSDFSSDSHDPLLGLVFTQSIGRHGINAAGLWKFNTGGGDPDLFRYDAAYVYRLAPEEFSIGNSTAWFGVLELNGWHETNGDNELFLSPGVQYVTSRWALEGTVQIPIWQDLDARAERDFIVGLSLRLRF
ncbi:MAG: transporter [Phycisphaerales bacterium]|nr:MAG: transporter [Phycisphaerales bacterium]